MRLVCGLWQAPAGHTSQTSKSASATNFNICESVFLLEILRNWKRCLLGDCFSSQVQYKADYTDEACSSQGLKNVFYKPNPVGFIGFWFFRGFL